MASVESVPAFLQPGVQVSQPPHLEGDPSLATEILPGPPPLASIQQAAIPRKDHKKPIVTYSYLPASDPGTTYTHFAGTLSAAPTEMDGSRRKRGRLDKGVESSRSQRASARSLAVVAPPSDHIIVPPEATASSSHVLSDFDPALLPLDSDDPMVSRATSFHAEDSPPEAVEQSKRHRVRPTGKDKGKGKEREPMVRVKEEPGVVSLNGETAPSLPNEDHCSACRSLGALVYCDGCPRAFHWLCLDPPMEATDLPEGESRWFCPACTLEQRPSPKPPSSLKFLAPLVHELAAKIPTEFQLPQDVRSFFKDVGTGPRGAYQDMSEVKQPRFNRHGQLEDRDPYRLKDRNGDPVLCFRCGTSALPPGLAADSPTAKRARRASSSNANNYETGRAIISCDYCHLHWHLNCVDPPMILMPPWSKKWMCPNHAERVLQPKRRIPRANATPIEITKPRQWNNGSIEIIQAEIGPPPAPQAQDKLNVDEVLINGRRYRVPERIITLDFWDKVARNRRGDSASESREIETSSGLSSPLTSLSSLDGDSVPPYSIEPSVYNTEDIGFAQMLCDMQLQGSSNSSVVAEENGKGRTNGVPKVSIKVEPQDGMPQNHRHKTMTGGATTGSISAETSRPRRVAAARSMPARSRSARRSGRSKEDDVPMEIDLDLPDLVISSGKRPDARRKAARPPEAVATPQPSAPTTNGIQSAGDMPPPDSIPTTSTSAAVSRPKRSRQPVRQKATSGKVTIKMDPDQNVTDLSKLEPTPSKAGSSRKKMNGTGESTSISRNHKPVTPPTNGQASATQSKTEATPTLKIRLPRLGAFSSPSTTAASQSAAAEASKVSPTKAPAASVAVSRPRRSLRRRGSIPTPLNSASVSETGSSRVNGPSVSPLESS